ncbi:DUF6814 family protein [Flavobacterium aquidurense]|jgi:hypothetical protein|uniref:Uncharacterized protein n=1 Tax=Flavobacterium azizsancarii TaxID=2961580 RepID=A0ABT4WD86_9FLAO|nr:MULTISPECIES: hypothetical protein [Flavobacterium]MDA6070533.1 hypothetical protein [Flavobacterium azizsancarii]OXA70081.1 hypothetical protein B0A67_17360 [Flavobacterium aquidurense]SHG13245.1 hypothetical protein SAMN05444481_102255 [Flavobacterium frigidimaris]
MNTIKQILGVLWIILAAAAAYFCVFEFGLPKLLSDQQDDLVFGIIILFILTPLIVLGLGTFGYFAVIGEYNDKKK